MCSAVEGPVEVSAVNFGLCIVDSEVDGVAGPGQGDEDEEVCTHPHQHHSDPNTATCELNSSVVRKTYIENTKVGLS